MSEGTPARDSAQAFRAPQWYPWAGGALCGLLLAAIAGAYEEPAHVLALLGTAFLLTALIRRLRAEATGVRASALRRGGRELREAAGVGLAAGGVWAVCSMSGASPAVCIAAPALMGAVACWSVLQRRNRSAPVRRAGAHARPTV
ncbi:hypothetical protein [Streptomyces sp. NPDC001665]